MAKYKWKHKRKIRGTFNNAIAAARTTVIVENEVTQLLNNFIGDPVNAESLHSMQTSLMNMFSELVERRIVSQPEVVINQADSSIEVRFNSVVPLERLELTIKLNE